MSMDSYIGRSPITGLPTEDYYDKAGVEERSNTKRRSYAHITRTAAASGTISPYAYWPILTGSEIQSDEFISGSQDLISLDDFEFVGNWIRRLTINADCIVIPSMSIFTSSNMTDVYITRNINTSDGTLLRYTDTSTPLSLTLGPLQLSSGDAFYSGLYVNQAAGFKFLTGSAVAYEAIEI